MILLVNIKNVKKERCEEMKNIHKYLLRGIFTVGLVTLAACDNSSPKTNHVTTQQSQKNDSQQQNDEVNNTANNSNEDIQIPSPKVKPVNTNTVKEDSNDTEENNPLNHDVATNEIPLKNPKKPLNSDVAVLKEEYLKKLNDIKQEMSAKRKELENQSTYALKNLEGNRYDVLDKALNDIYGTSKQQLPTEKMEQLRKEQREWLTLRENKAEEASHKYKGGTEELLEYVTVKNNLTENRCFELVTNYMK